MSCFRSRRNQALCVIGAWFVVLTQGEAARAATSSSSVGVAAQVANTCTLTITTNLNFGPVDITSPTPTDSFGSISIGCTNNAPVYITLGQGANPGSGSTNTTPVRQMSAGGADRLDYDLYSDPTFTTPWGNTQATGVTLTGSGAPVSASIYARVPPGQHVASGVYQDSVVLTVTY